MIAPVLCTQCQTPLPAAQLGVPDFSDCPACHAPLLVRVFPALFQRAQPGVSGERITEAGQAACFYHPNKTAHVPCDDCGRFVCALCDVELHGQHLCPSCVESGRRKGALTTLESGRMLWDNIALSVAVLPTLLCFWISVMTAPAAIILAIIGWRKPGSLAPRWTKFRFVSAIFISFAALAGLGLFIYFLSTESGPFK